MAEFKLGRIRFVWKNDWTSSTVYYKDDVVRYGGRTYICAVGHTSADNFYTDLDYSPTRWNQMTDGTEYAGDWSFDDSGSPKFYKENDVVKYGGRLYIAVNAHTASGGAPTAQDAGSLATNGLEADISNWNVYAEGTDWKGDWTTTTRYKENDVVKYGGYTYICNSGHTSAATEALGLENNDTLWDEYNEGIEYKGLWVDSVARYKLNDVVKYGAGLWICTTSHVPSADFETDESNWSQFADGFEYEGDWNVASDYQIGDIVSYGGNQYVAKTNHTGEIPSSSVDNWDLFNEGFNFQSDWDVTTSYRIGQVVRLNGYTFLATTDVPSFNLTINNTNDTTNDFSVADTTGLEVDMAIVFSGSVFGDVAPGATYYVKEIISSIAFTVTDSVGGNVFTPATGSGSMTANVAAKPPNSSYWTRLSSGISWQGLWQDDNEYVQGDAVRFGSNSYICIQNHRSEGDDGSTIGPQGGGASMSRPDLDLNGLYWNLLSVGSEVDILSEPGDLVYFAGSGPARLSLGSEGQVLRAGEIAPEWVTLGAIDHVYYVSGSGTDLPAPIHGKSLDKPWKTIRYAAEQVEKGPRVPNSAYLLEMNRVFIQREVTEYIQYQIANAAPGSIWENFEYEDYACERDVGFYLDAIIFDLKHGGNVKTRGVANALVGAITEDSPGAYPGLSVEGPQSIEAYNYAVTLLGNVLNQEAPAVNYQVLNGDNSTAIVEQFFDNTITAETEYTGTGTGLGAPVSYGGGVGGFGGSSGSGGY